MRALGITNTTILKSSRTGLILGARETCYHQGPTGFGVLNGVRVTVTVEPLGEQRTILKSDAMDSELIETVCRLHYHDGGRIRTGFGFYERCMGTLA